MAVIGTPAINPTTCCDGPSSQPNLAAVPCDEQGILSAPVSQVRGQPVLSRMRALNFTQGQCGAIEWTMHNRAGNPVNLSGCLSDGGTPLGDSSSAMAGSTHVVFRMHESLSLGRNGNACRFEADAEIIDAAAGKVRVNLPDTAVALPGVYFGEMALVDDDTGCVRFSNVFYVTINRGLFGSATCGGPPSLAEIRLHLRDSGGAESYLLDNLAFDDAEIASCITRAVDFWNEMPPNVRRYTTRTFPFRFHWLTAICGYLFLIASEGYRKNNLQYSAAGVSVNDMDKSPAYEQAAQSRLAEWREFVRVKKVSMNLEEGFGGASSPYGYYQQF